MNYRRNFPRYEISQTHEACVRCAIALDDAIGIMRVTGSLAATATIDDRLGGTHSASVKREPITFDDVESTGRDGSGRFNEDAYRQH